MRPPLNRHMKDKFGVSVYKEVSSFIQKCSACQCKLRSGEAIVYLNGAHKYHRQCLKDFMEWTYEAVPASADERVAAEGGLLEQIDTERSARDFEAYRSQLLAKLSSEPACQVPGAG